MVCTIILSHRLVFKRVNYSRGPREVLHKAPRDHRYGPAQHRVWQTLSATALSLGITRTRARTRHFVGLSLRPRLSVTAAFEVRTSKRLAAKRTNPIKFERRSARANKKVNEKTSSSNKNGLLAAASGRAVHGLVIKTGKKFEHCLLPLLHLLLYSPSYTQIRVYRTGLTKSSCVRWTLVSISITFHTHFPNGLCVPTTYNLQVLPCLVYICTCDIHMHVHI